MINVWSLNVATLLTLQQILFIHLFIYLCRTGGYGPTFSSQNWAGSGSTIKPVRGPHVFRTMKKAFQRTSVATAKQAKMSQIAHPMVQELCFVKTQT